MFGLFSSAGKHNLKPVSALKESDKNFNTDLFTEEISNVYVTYKSIKSEKELYLITPYFDLDYSDGLTKSVSHKTPVALCVLSADIEGWYEDNNYTYIQTKLYTRESDRFDYYSITVRRKKGVLTPELSGVKAQNCPNCGAPVNINKSTFCEYCDSVLENKKFNWKITEIKKV